MDQPGPAKERVIAEAVHAFEANDAARVRDILDRHPVLKTMIGPLPTTPGIAYTAQFMEAVFRPGMKSRVHRHSGVEAWYTVSGETCLETPEGTMVGRAGGSHVIVPAGPPMELTATGADVRRALVLILHDSAQPHTSPASDWTPKGLCKG